MVRPGFKQTEAGEIPEDWDVKNVSSIALITTGSKNTKDHIDDGLYPFFVRSQVIEHINTYSFDGEAVLTAGDGVGTGKIFHYINGKFDFHQRVYNIYGFKPEVDGFYFYKHFSNRFYERIMSMTAKSSVDSVRREMIAEMKIALPTKTEQKSIAKALSDVDELIVSLEKLIAKKCDIKTATMQQLLTGKKRLPGFCSEWLVKKLGEIAELDPENLSSSTRPEYEFKYISLEDVDRGVLSGYSEQIYKTSPSRARRVLKQRDILVSTVRPNLKSHLLFNIFDTDWICSTGFSVLRCNPKKSMPEYVYYHLFSGGIERQIETMTAGSNYPAINSGDVRGLEILIPEIDEQRAISRILIEMDSELSYLTAQLNKNKAIKQGMMQELLNGRTRLVDVENHHVKEERMQGTL
jgi:type I restriction enzyme, S subunit